MKNTPILGHFLATAFALSVLSSAATAQCTTDWETPDLGFGVAGTIESVGSWDPDGAGPQPALSVFGGQFARAGASLAENIAFFDHASQSFSFPPQGVNGEVLAVLDAGNGELIVAGDFSAAGGVSGTTGVARWNGSTWSAIGGGIAGTGRALATLTNGDLVVGGQFAAAGGVAVNGIARWDGTSWHDMDQGVSYASGTGAGSVATLQTLPNGDLAVGGAFDTAGTVATTSIARWDGTAWHALDTGLGFTWSSTFKLVLRNNGNLAAIGFSFVTPSMAILVNGVWSSVAGAPANCRDLYETGSGDLIVAEPGNFLLGGPKLHVYSQGTWSILASSPVLSSNFGKVTGLPGGGPDDLVVGGTFSSINGVTTRNLARYEAGNWFGSAAADLGPNNEVRAFATGPDGTVYAGGLFTEIGGTPANFIGRWDGSTWQPLGAGTNGIVRSIAIAGNGDVYVCGSFSMAGSVSAFGVARWDGTTWSDVPGIPFTPQRVASRRNGNVLIAGYNLSEVTPTGIKVYPDAFDIQHCIELPNGDIAASGNLQNWGAQASARTAIWNGTQWQTTTYEHTAPEAIGVASNGDLVLSAGFFNGEHVMRWDNTSWQPLGDGLDNTVFELTNLPGGELVAAGSFLNSGTTPMPYLATFDGNAWLPLGGVGSTTRAVHFSPTGTLYAASMAPSIAIARRSTDCPAAVQSTPANCSGPTQPELTATSWPYVGANYLSRGRNAPIDGLVVDLYGFASANTPLNSLLGSATTGCTLLLDPAILQTVTPEAGTATTELAIPSSIVLAGMDFWQQLVPFAIDSQGNIAGSTASNALQLTIGSY